MKKNRSTNRGFFIARVFVALTFCFVAAGLTLLATTFSIPPATAASETRNPAAPSPSVDAPMPPNVKRAINATMAWVASFRESDDESRRLIKTAASGIQNSSIGPRALSPFVSDAVNAILSPPVRDLPAVSPFTISTGQPEEGELSNREPRPSTNPDERDPVIQDTIDATAAMPPVGASFDGINNAQGCNGCIPPDPVGAVGPNHYVQMVNSHFAIYSKTGAVLSAPKAINTLWSAVPNSTCATHNNGDPIVVYDQLADRWLLSQFTVQSGTENYAECIAISQTPDPTGSYYLYQFDLSADTFHDYPHIGIWPDGYYMTTDLFPNDALLFSTGAGAWAFERQKMLLGQAARYVYFDETSLATDTYTPGGQLPTSLEGKNPPPPGTPNFFVEVNDTDTPNAPPATGLHDEMHIWKFHVDWVNPANSTFGTGSSAPAAKPGFTGLFAGNAGQPNFVVPIADFIPVPCQYASGPNCIPQKITPGQPTEYLEALGDRLMYRVTYRNFGDHESLLAQHTAQGPADQPGGVARAGVRWYEFRNVSVAPNLYQQSTFAPLDPASLDGPLWRWMGSAAMDHVGNIAIAYSASGPNYFPSLHYAGRLAGDPLNELTQGEAKLFQGLGIETAVPNYLQRNRWGDYSNLTVDPADDCTFWYTNEYMPPNGPIDVISTVEWRTRIGSFKFPQCTVATPALLNVVSRKTHGTESFDIPLPQTGTRGVECRSGGPSGDFTIVFQFANPITNCGSSPNGTVQPGASSNECAVQLTGVPDGQYATVTLNGVLDDHAGQGNLSATFGVLLGDVSGNGAVSNTDVAAVKGQVSAPVTASNCRDDVTTNGAVSNTDVSVAKGQVGNTLPSTP
ncbi:MAG TPA: hypothetical protein VJ719_14680 [Chthoniobacterales bacterium]|nr:hypothetical protein [Chthoniobacterales bacterium]